MGCRNQKILLFPYQHSGKHSYQKLGECFLIFSTGTDSKAKPPVSDIGRALNPDPSLVPPSPHPTSAEEGIDRRTLEQREAPQVQLRATGQGLRPPSAHLLCSAGGNRVPGKMCTRPPQLGKLGADNRAPPRPGGVEREGKRG